MTQNSIKDSKYVHVIFAMVDILYSALYVAYHWYL